MPLKKIAFACFALCLASVHAQITQSGQYYSFKAKYRKGQVIQYNSATTLRTVQIKNRFAKIVQSISMEVTGLYKGLATIQISQGTAKMDNKPIGAPVKSTVVLDAHNLAQLNSHDAGIFTSIPYPPAKIQIGGQWAGNATFSFAGSSAGANVSTYYRFLGFKTVAGRRVAVLTVDLKGFANGSGNIEIDPANGFLRKASLHVTLNTTTQGPIPVDVIVQRVQ